MGTPTAFPRTIRRFPQASGRRRSRYAVSRRSLLAGGFGLGAAGVLAACGGQTAASTSGSAVGGGGDVRFAWWGNDYLNRQTDEVIAAFTSQHPDAAIDGEPGQWGSYWDRLATQAAAGDEPAIINMDQKYISEYGGRGVLADLTSLEGLDLGTIDPGALEAGTVDGTLYGISTGQNSYCVLANRAVFDDAGVEIPDDTTWTWADYARISREIQASRPDTIGTVYGVNEAYLVTWLRQHGEDLYSTDGGLGYRTQTLTQMFTHLLDLMETRAGFDASGAAEELGVALEQSAFGTNKAGLTWAWANQFSSFVATTGSDLVMLRPPSIAGSAAENGAYFKPTMFWSLGAAAAANPTAVSFLNFLVNDPEAAAILRVDRGAPANSATESAVIDVLEAPDRTFLDFMSDIGSEITSTPVVPPRGSSDTQNVLARYVEQVLFKQSTPQEAAEAFTSEVTGVIESA
ncbi:ABC transporter substrate-binding protein [Zhihengliuella halotolerans]|uniref:Carbohydrate ABC transporter substrate-binding protein (CUT1 family) n=1 Tax=Zhihengliuella halotolerans TaxID=370736 RepID=A0A4Q8AGQ3_9MICC|nr:ABC transporter substrate-binding protein [Zhihengliuella halotolerans]RZU63560.1 carbohydrate ABC transporter substrate-binding protein (CUT1 family) [Zhihengliuella halotolerans]